MLSILAITSLPVSFGLDKLIFHKPTYGACSFQICTRKIMKSQFIIYTKKRWVSFLILQRQSAGITQNPFKPYEYDCAFGRVNSARSKQTFSKCCLYYSKNALNTYTCMHFFLKYTRPTGCESTGALKL